MNINKKYPDIQMVATNHLYRVVTKCRMCKTSDLTQYLDLGFTPPSDQFRKKEELVYAEISYPLRVLLCKNCGLSQLSHVVNPRVLYQYDYPYEQSITKTGKTHWDNFAEVVTKELSLNTKDLIVDFGSNTGTLLNSFKQLGMTVFGIDPAPNIVKIANEENGIRTICDFFNRKSAGTILKKAGRASVVVGSNVFAHIDDLDEVLLAAKKILKKDGVFIFESPYFQHLIDNLEYDTVYHEHLSYLSVKPLIPFFKKFGMEVFKVQGADIHGGSFRIYAGRTGVRPIDPSVNTYLREEEKHKLHEVKTMNEFANKVLENRRKIRELIEDLRRQGKKVAAISAPAKGMTLLNYCGLTDKELLFVSEKARLKIGRYTPAGHIPIVSDEYLIKERPDYALLLAWNFSKEIVKNLKEFSDNGGRFIIPIPEPKII